ncbi:MAG: hypothetical protein WC489_06535 [Patescibacteria group bacterium]
MTENMDSGAQTTANTPNSRMNRVIERLTSFTHNSASFIQERVETTQKWSKNHLTERDLHKKVEEIERFRTYYRADMDEATERLRSEYSAFNEKMPQTSITKELLQTHLVGYLFEANRAMFAAEKGSMDLYDYAKEQRQIEGVLRALDGQHLHMGTGEGKSSVVIPIASVVEALTSDRRDIVVSSSNWTLVHELKTNIERYTKAVDSIGLAEGGFQLDDAKREDPDHKKADDLRAGMEKEALESDSFSGESIDLNKQDHWDTYFEQLTKKDGFEKLKARASKEKSPRIVFASEKDLVFTYMENKSQFASICPKIYMDEADTPFNRATPYQNVAEKFDVSPEEINQATDDWLLYFMTAQQVHEDDIVADQGSYALTERAMERLEKIRLEDIRHDIEQDADTSPWTASFRRGVEVIIDQRGMDKAEATEFMRRIHNRLKERFPKHTQGEQALSLQEYVVAAGDKIAGMMKEEERAFTLDQSGKPVIRDSYIDELLSEHKYDRETQLAVLAISSRFEVLGRALAHRTVRFPTFIHAVADKLTCFSGTLLYPDPQSGKIKKGMLGAFLEEQTGRKVALISPPEVKTVPKPKLFATDEEARGNLIRGSSLEQEDKPVLFIDFNGLKSTRQTYEALVARYGTDRVALLPPKPTGNEDEENAYQVLLNDLTTRLAQGELKAVVSSGVAGVGINIVAPDGTFPDLNIALLGVPASDQQLVQAVGRRRKPLKQGEQSFFWTLSLENLESSLSTYQKQATKYQISVGKNDWSREKMRRHLEKVKDKPEKLFETVLDLIQKKQQITREDTDMVIAYDAFFERFSELCMDKLEQRLRRDVLHLKDGQSMTRKQREILAVYSREMGLPANLYWDVLSERTMVGNYAGAGINLNSRKAAFEYFQYHVLAGFAPQAGFGVFKEKSPVLDWLDQWYERSLPSVQKYCEAIHSDYFQQAFDAKDNMGTMIQVSPYTDGTDTLKRALPEGVAVAANELSVYAGPPIPGLPADLFVVRQGDKYYKVVSVKDEQYLGLGKGAQAFVRINEFTGVTKNGKPVYFLFTYPFSQKQQL